MAWTLIALVGFAVLPLYSTASGGESSDGTTWETTGEETLVEHEGLGVLVVLLVPTALAFMGLVGAAFGMRPLTIGTAGITCVLCVLTGFSVGLFYLPTAVLLVIAAARSRPAESGSRSHDGGASWQRHLLLGFCTAWTVGALLLAGVGISQANDDAVVLVIAATTVGVGAAATSVWLVVTDRLRWAGVALIVSAVTPTWAAAIVSLPALVVGIALAAGARTAASGVTSVR